MGNVSSDYVIHDLNRAMALCRIGFMKVTEHDSDEDIMLRVTYQLLEIMLRNIIKQVERG